MSATRQILIERCKKEPGLLCYEWFFNDDETELYAHEWYVDSAAVGAHMEFGGEELEKLLEAAPPNKVDVYGNLTAELREKLLLSIRTSYPAGVDSLAPNKSPISFSDSTKWELISKIRHADCRANHLCGSIRCIRSQKPCSPSSSNTDRNPSGHPTIHHESGIGLPRFHSYRVLEHR